MELSSCLSAVKDVVQIVGSLGLLVLGALGLGTWRRQLKGSLDYQLAKDILAATYRAQDAIRIVRSPFFYISLIPMSPDRRLEEEHRNLQERLDRLEKPWTELRGLQLEAKVVWGNYGQEPIGRLNGIIGMLRNAMSLNFDIRTRFGGVYPLKDPDPELASEMTKDNTDFVYDSDSANNKYTRALSDVIGEIETACKAKLGR